MYSSKNPKISQHTRTQIWKQYNSSLAKGKKITQASLALQYGISRQTVSSCPRGQLEQVQLALRA